LFGRLQGYTPQPPPLDNGLPGTRGRGRPPKDPSHTHTPSTPPAHSPRPRGRPPKNKNKHKRLSSDLVPKTSPANKRLRKSSQDAVTPRVNGVSDVPLDLLSRTKVKTTRELLQSIQQESSLDQLRSRTLTSLGVPRSAETSTPSTSRPPSSLPLEFLSRRRVKQESAVRPRTPSPAGSDVDVEIISGGEDTPSKLPKSEPEPPAEKKPETIQDIYARLPPIDPDAIHWSEDEVDEDEDVVMPEVRDVTSEDVQRVCETHIECVNGNKSAIGRVPTAGEWLESPHGLKVAVSAEFGASQPTCSADCSFREWHEMLSRPSYQGELLHILPYVIID